jgi:arylsulfatase A-like enzyme
MNDENLTPDSVAPASTSGKADRPDTSRRDFLIGAAAAATAVAFSPHRSSYPQTVTGSTKGSRPERYNIMLITVDQERFFLPYPVPVPGRERLMKQGVTFTHHENCSNVCTSSRSVIYTGWHMPKTAMFDNTGLPWMDHNLDAGLGTLGTLLTQAGYYAAYKGKWHLSNELDHSNLTGGRVDVGMQPSAQFHQIMQQYGFQDYHGIGDVIGWSQGGYLYDSVTTGQTINWLRGQGQALNRSGERWFLAVNLVNPHDVMFIDTDKPGEQRQWTGSLNDGGVSMNPAQPPDHEIYRATWNNIPLPASRHQPFEERGRPAAHREYQYARAALVGQFPDEDWRWRKLQDYYLNCIRDCDVHLVRILDELDRLKLTSNTIVVFTADHGELGGSHRMHGKGSSVYREQMHVPLMILHPAYAGGKRCQALTCHLDLAPTLVGLTGLPEDRRRAVLGDRKGRDLSPLLVAPEKADVHSVRNASLYCYGMILYADAEYLTSVQAIKHRGDLDAEGRQQAIERLRPDFTKRSAIRCINDGQYKFARYFSLREHHIPRSVSELFAHNDVELFDLAKDPEELHNLALEPQRNADTIARMNDQLNALVAEEIGTDDGSYLPLSGLGGWNLQVAIE